MRARHAKLSLLRTATVTTGLATAVAVPLLSSAPAQAAPGASTAALQHAAVAYHASAPVRSAYHFGWLQHGSRGSTVAELQRRVHVSDDGVFGPVTRHAVVAFQERHDLEQDGVVGPKTGAALNGRSVLAKSVRTASVRAEATRSTRSTSSSVGASAVREAASHRGAPYVYGAAGPDAFDCSGFVQYVYGQVGVRLPRTAAAQATATRRVSQSDKQLGDLILITEGGRVGHVGIYAGNNTMWVARHSGTTVTQQAIYTSSYTVGRVA